MTVLNLQVGASGDDSGTLLLSFAFDSTGAGHHVGNAGGNTGELWCRWTNVTVAQGTTLASAIISLYNAPGHGGNTSIAIKSLAENADNHTAPTSGSDANGRTLTTGTAWAGFGPSVDNTWYTCDIVSEIQAVVNRSGWSSGNAIGVRTIDNGSTSNSGLYVRSYDNDSTKAAKLDITYTAGGTGAGNLLLLGCGA